MGRSKNMHSRVHSHFHKNGKLTKHGYSRDDVMGIDTYVRRNADATPRLEQAYISKYRKSKVKLLNQRNEIAEWRA